MSLWVETVFVEPVCDICGAEVRVDGIDCQLDWRDETEERHGLNAIAVQAHKHEKHRVTPVVGDLVTYAYPWRGVVLESTEVYRVEAIIRQDRKAFARRMGSPDLEPVWGLSHRLVSLKPNRSKCFPFVGESDQPVTFRIVESAPFVEVDLLDLLDWSAA